MTEEEAEHEADERARSLIRAAWTTTPRPDHRERVLDALDAADAKRVKAAAAERVVPIRPRSVWPVVAAAIVAIAAAALLVAHHREHTQRLVTPGTEWTPGTAAPMPPRHGGQ